MDQRTIFPKVKLFKKTVTEHTLIALYEIYRIHPQFPYQDEEKLSDISIIPSYGNIEYEGKTPQLVVKVGGYNFNLQDTLGKNMYGFQENEDGVATGYRSLKDMGTGITILVRAMAEEESSDLADELSFLATMGATHMFNQVGLNVRGSSVSETVQVDNQTDWWQTVVNLSVLVPFEFGVSSDAEPIDPTVEYEFDDEVVKGYRAPETYTFRNTNKW